MSQMGHDRKHSKRANLPPKADIETRRVATYYDKLAANDLAFIQLASIRLWLRDNESTP